MATTTADTAPKPIATTADVDEQHFLTPERIRIFGIAGAVLLVIALVIWFVVTSGRRKETYANAALEEARTAAAQNNFGVAVQGFNRVITGFSGTSAAYEATLGIAQTHLIAEQNELAVTGLSDFLKTNPPPQFAASGNALLGNAYENLSEFAKAEEAYRKASELATMDYLKANSLIDAGRAARLAKKPDEAKAIYNEIITKYPKSGSVTEAQVRLAELGGG